jgi:hypothetical protein
MSKLETNTIDTVSGTTNLKIGDTNTNTVELPSGVAMQLKGDNNGSSSNNELIFEDTDTAIQTGQTAGKIIWKQNGGTLGTGTVGVLECATEGTGGSYFMSFRTGSVVGSGNGNELTEQMRINSSGQLLMQNGSLFSGSIKNMSVADIYIATGTNAGSYTTTTEGSDTIYGSSHTFNYGFTAADADKVAFAAHQMNHNNGGHFSKDHFDFASRSTTGATLKVYDRAGSSNVDMRIICVEYA